MLCSVEGSRPILVEVQALVNQSDYPQPVRKVAGADQNLRLAFFAAAVALAWLIARRTVTAPIASATSLAQLNELIGATKLELDEASMGLLNRASDGQG